MQQRLRQRNKQFRSLVNLPSYVAVGGALVSIYSTFGNSYGKVCELKGYNNMLGVFHGNRNVIRYTPIRGYRNILHDDEPKRPFTARIFPLFIGAVFMCFVIDFKKLFGLHDYEKEMDELMNYKIPDVIVTYSKAPEIDKTSNKGTHQGKNVTDQPVK